VKAQVFWILLACAQITRADSKIVFEDRFRGKMDQGWTWIRENRAAWRSDDQGLWVRIEPGNMWGPPNNARNVLVRPAPDFDSGPMEISVTVSNQPTGQYEQADLAWYYDDSHMVKIGQELVDGKLSIVMGREEKDRTRTIAIIPLASSTVTVGFIVSSNQLTGRFRLPREEAWREAGRCDFPAPANARPKISLQFYQGPSDAEHWVRVTDFRIQRLQ